MYTKEKERIQLVSQSCRLNTNICIHVQAFLNLGPTLPRKLIFRRGLPLEQIRPAVKPC